MPERVGPEGPEVPEVPRSVTDGTLERQQAAGGDKLKEAAIKRKDDIKDSFPEAPDFLVGGPERKKEEQRTEGTYDETLDDGMDAAIDRDEQNRWNRFADAPEIPEPPRKGPEQPES